MQAREHSRSIDKGPTSLTIELLIEFVLKRGTIRKEGGGVNHSLINIYYLIPIYSCRAGYKYVCMLRMLEMIKTVLLYSSVQVLSTDMIKMNNMGEYIYTEKGSVYIYPPPTPPCLYFLLVKQIR